MPQEGGGEKVNALMRPYRLSSQAFGAQSPHPVGSAHLEGRSAISGVALSGIVKSFGPVGPARRLTGHWRLDQAPARGASSRRQPGRLDPKTELKENE